MKDQAEGDTIKELLCFFSVNQRKIMIQWA